MIVSGPVTHTIHNHRDNIFLHESNLLTAFYNMTSRLSGHNFKPFFVAAPNFETRLPLACLVEAEIMSPYCGILINTGVGNQNVPFAQPLGIGEY